MEKLPPMIDMRSDNDGDENPFSGAYPYGLCISLGNNELEKLGLDPEDCEVGDMLHIHALAKVTSVSCHDREGQDGECHRIELQITHFMDDVEDEDEENREEETKMSPSQRLYK